MIHTRSQHFVLITSGFELIGADVGRGVARIAIKVFGEGGVRDNPGVHGRALRIGEMVVEGFSDRPHEMSGGVRNVFVENCYMSSPNLDRAIRLRARLL